MKALYKMSVAAALLGATFLTPSCTNLDETIYSEVTADNYYKSGDEVMAALLRPWGHFSGSMFAQAPYLLQELTADGVAWPQKGRHGYDGGAWIRLHRHQWTPIENEVERAWYLMYMGIGLANNMLADIENIDFEALKVPISKEQAKAEMRTYRAYCYWYLMDLYGDVPITETIGEMNPATNTRKEVFDYVVKELTESIPSLSESKIDSYGRVSKWGAMALLAKVYLNAEVYSGTAHLDDCISVCNELQANGGFVLDKNWNDPFKADNDKVSTENIWVVAYDQIYGKGMGWYLRWFHYAHQSGWNLKSGPWNGLVCQPDFYVMFADNDKRKTEGFLIGTQYPRKKDENGNYYFDTNAQPLLGSEEYAGEPLVLVKDIKSMTEGEENSGARSIKYEVIEQSLGDQDNDWVIFRYSDILFMKAEALMRKNGNNANQEVVDLVNSVRERAFDAADWEKAKYTTATLTMDEFLRERGREFAFEGCRRTDMIRFGKYVTTSWWDHPASMKAEYNLFPVPSKQLASNPNLKPNAANSLY